MTRKLAAVAAGGFLTVGSSFGLSALTAPAWASGPTTASGLFSEAISDADSGGWVHEATVTTGSGHRVSMNDDIGTSSGRQVIDDNGGQMTVLFLGGTAYVEGNAQALHRDLAAPSQDATELAGHWLSIPPGNQLFGPVSDAVTLKSDFDQHRLTGPLKEGRQVRIDGVPAIPLTGTLAGAPHHERIAATFYVSAGSQPLPLEFRASGHGVSTQTRWTGWGQTVLLSVPPNAVSLGAGAASSSG